MVHEDSVAGGGAPVVYGLVSRGHESCGQGTRYPGIYVDVYDHISWIDDRLALDWYSKHNSPVWSGPGSTSSAPRPTLYMTMWAALIAILFV